MPGEEFTANGELCLNCLCQPRGQAQLVVFPLVKHLVGLGWLLEQITFGKREWRVPKNPSEASKREKKQSFEGFPIDIALFDSPEHAGDPRHLLMIIECKQPTEEVGGQQLETYLALEPHVKLGVWSNDGTQSAPAVFLYRKPNGTFLRKRRLVADLPRPGEKISPTTQKLLYKDLLLPTTETFKKTMEDLVDRIVMVDSNVTRREDQLDQLCNLLLLKLDSDKRAKVHATEPPSFRPSESANRTAREMAKRFANFVELYPEVFTTDKDREIRFNDETVNAIVEELYRLRLLDLGVSTISLGFQVLRTAALKQGEGQFFTPREVIEAGVKLLQIDWEDLVIDPACGTGGFLVQVILEMQQQYPTAGNEVSRWAQTHIFGIEKDTVGVKLTKAIMQILGDGSAHCVRGDAVRTHNWTRDFPHLSSGQFGKGRFSVVVTNPPFGTNLKVSAEDARLAKLDIAETASGEYRDLEIGLLFLNRAYELLRPGGRVGIVLPETYFFSPQYSFLFSWITPRLKPLVVANIPMEAFQGFCRAKTNFYVFEKIK